MRLVLIVDVMEFHDADTFKAHTILSNYYHGRCTVVIRVAVLLRSLKIHEVIDVQ